MDANDTLNTMLDRQLELLNKMIATYTPSPEAALQQQQPSAAQPQQPQAAAPSKDPTGDYMRSLREYREAARRGEGFGTPPEIPATLRPGQDPTELPRPAPPSKGGEDPTTAYMRTIRERREAMANRQPWEWHA